MKASQGRHVVGAVLAITGLAASAAAMIGMAGMAGMIGMAGMAGMTEPHDAPPPRRRSVDRPNVVMAGPVFELPYPGVTLGYQRAVHRAFSLRADLGHMVSPKGFTHIPGLSASTSVSVWLLRPLEGPYLAAGGGVGGNFWTRRPDLHDITGFADFAVGYRFSFPIGLTLGASAGLRYGFEIDNEPRICTHQDICRNARTGLYPRLVVDIGWRFGRRHPNSSSRSPPRHSRPAVSSQK